MIILFDIDGVLADYRHRIGVDPDSKKYNKLMEVDPLFDEGAWLLDGLATAWSEHSILGLTGRHQSRESITRQWLEEWQLYKSFDGILYRPDEWVGKPDDKFKESIIKQLGIKNIALAVDDKPSVVDMYRKHGISCLHAKFFDLEERN